MKKRRKEVKSIVRITFTDISLFQFVSRYEFGQFINIGEVLLIWGLGGWRTFWHRTPHFALRVFMPINLCIVIKYTVQIQFIPCQPLCDAKAWRHLTHIKVFCPLKFRQDAKNRHPDASQTEENPCLCSGRFWQNSQILTIKLVVFPLCALSLCISH